MFVFSEDDEEYYYSFKSSFVEPRHEDDFNKDKDMPTQNWRAKERVSISMLLVQVFYTMFS